MKKVVMLIVALLFLMRISYAEINGDVNNDGVVDEADINAVVFHILARSAAAGSADCNGDKIVDVGDVVYLMNSLYKELPPDPREVASELDPSVATNFAESIEFLFKGPNPVQTDVTTGSIESRRSGVIRGRVIGLDSRPIPGVTVTILHHPEFGRTKTRGDGMFDMTVNCGGWVTVQFFKPMFMPAQRMIITRWNDFHRLRDDVVMIGYDPKATVIDLESEEEMQAAEASIVTDEDGTRKATLLFPRGNRATMVLSDSTTHSLKTITVRITEYTVGKNGPKAMPSQLPSGVGYTYCAEFSVDEALAAGARKVQFDKPVYFYLENFLDVPVATTIPLGYYNMETGKWMPLKDGVVLKILSITGGLADVDTNDDKVKDSQTILDKYGISKAEQLKIAQMYQVGQILWRVPMNHFTPHDLNWMNNLKNNCPSPRVSPSFYGSSSSAGGSSDNRRDCEKNGSIIKCQKQAIAEKLPVTGTPFNLYYQSNRVSGRADLRALDIPLGEVQADTGNPERPPTKRIVLEIEIAGQFIKEEFPAISNQNFRFTWDGKDAYGRTVQGAQTAHISLGYVYDSHYYYSKIDPTWPTFGSIQGYPYTVDYSREEATLWQKIDAKIGCFEAKSLGLGGWSISLHHAYDPFNKILYLGNGEIESADIMGYTITTFAGSGPAGFGQGGYGGDAGPATEARLNSPCCAAVAPDGSVYIADTGNNRIRKVTPDGIIHTVAGNGTRGYSGDGGPAVDAKLSAVSHIALGLDGSLFISDSDNNRIRKVSPDGIISTICGNGKTAYIGVHIPPEQYQLWTPRGIAVSPDGRIFINDYNHFRIIMIGNNGLTSVYAGDGSKYPSGGGLPSNQSSIGSVLSSLSLGADGSLYFAHISDYTDYIYQITPQCIFKHIGSKSDGYEGDGGPFIDAKFLSPKSITPDANNDLYICDTGNEVIRRVTTDGIVNTIAGIADVHGFSGDSGPALQARLDEPVHIAVGQKGLYISDNRNQRIRYLYNTLSEFVSADEIAVPAADGSEIFVFDVQGKHLRTLDAFTMQTNWTFSYDESGRLISLADCYGNTTLIDRDAQGNPMAIVAPGGQTTQIAINEWGYVSSIKLPGNRKYQFVSDEGGLIRQTTDPRGGVHKYDYDERGMLIGDENPEGKRWKINTTTTSNGYITAYTSPMDQISTYVVERKTNGDVIMRNIAPGRAENIFEVKKEGIQKTITASGMIHELENTSDPRFGVAAEIPKTIKITTPGGLQAVYSFKREIVQSDPKDYSTFASLKDTITLNGQNFIYNLDKTTRKLTRTSAGGRATIVDFDQFGRMTKLKLPNLTKTINYTYDDRGRLINIARGGKTKQFVYDDQNRLIRKSNIKGKYINYAFNDADQISTFTLPLGQKTGFEYDGAGNMNKVIMPNGDVHNLNFNSLNDLTSYDPPGDGSYEYTRDDDGRTTEVTLPSGRATQFLYDEGGRVIGILTDKADSSFVYYEAGGQCCESELLSEYERIPKQGARQKIKLDYDGDLIKQMSFIGATNGLFYYEYDINFYLTRLKFDNQSGILVDIPVARDADGNISVLGDFTFQRTGPSGALNKISNASMSVDLPFDTNGLPSGMTYKVNSNTIYNLQLTLDSTTAMITKKVEILDGATQTFEYQYDDNGRLINVTLNGNPFEAYTYDGNGNRQTRILGANPEETTNYGTGDILQRQGNLYYTFDRDGFMTARGNDYLTFSTTGEIAHALVNSSQDIFYDFDAIGRPVARTSPSKTWHYYYGNPANIYQVTHFMDHQNNVSTFYYTDNSLVFAMKKGSDWYYIGTDQVGSPRIIVDSIGATIRRIDYDSFGNITLDTNPDFYIPVGYAGGLPDPETRLVKCGARYYDPVSSRWLSRDPLLFAGGQGNLYVYVNNDPVNFRDPIGAFCLGAEAYEGVGGSFSVCEKDGDWSICGGLGIGLGGNVNASGGIEDTDFKTEVEFSVKCAGFGASAKCGLSKCADKTGCKAGGSLGPFKLDSEGGGGLGVGVKTDPGSLLEMGKCGLKGNFSFEYCSKF